MSDFTLKTDPAVFQDVLDGKKTFEIRFNDRGYQVGDLIVLKETKFTGQQMREGSPLIYTGREMQKQISYILSGYGLQDGWVILGITDFDNQQAKIEKLENELSTTKQVLGNVIDMEVAKVDDLKAQLNNMEACYIEKKKELEDQHKKVDEVLEYLDGESANRWGLWKEKADMLDQGASNAFEEAYWMVKKALRGEE